MEAITLAEPYDKDPGPTQGYQPFAPLTEGVRYPDAEKGIDIGSKLAGESDRAAEKAVGGLYASFGQWEPRPDSLQLRLEVFSMCGMNLRLAKEAYHWITGTPMPDERLPYPPDALARPGNYYGTGMQGGLANAASPNLNYDRDTNRANSTQRNSGY